MLDRRGFATGLRANPGNLDTSFARIGKRGAILSALGAIVVLTVAILAIVAGIAALGRTIVDLGSRAIRQTLIEDHQASIVHREFRGSRAIPHGHFAARR